MHLCVWVFFTLPQFIYFKNFRHCFDTIHTPFHLFRDKKKGFRGISETLKITVLNNNYSMIVATAPEPTVLPPSGYMNSVF